MIFDLGGVFIYHNRDPLTPEFVAKHTVPKETLARFYTYRYLDYEKGLISSQEFFKRAQTEAGYQGNYAEFREDYCRAFNLRLNEEMFSFFRKLKAKHGDEIELWLLSNIGEIHFEHINNLWPGIFSSFFKVHLSFRMGARKPDKEIYDRILLENKRTPYECAFVDDLAVNGEYPMRMGMYFHRFDGLPNFKRWLQGFGIIIE